ncbi:hypothetical protein COU49_01465 [Candidatus Nomurabacteria bacterium CG10_big_fil_rev_8_21_14_0_10_35_16]|uniref:Uncharacterized protein n=1 Tax=Candidatus Nomurabacteria bacterium CG10_big_fil_rev_8_21_14_0_10_35_16 TaxID=1974731 RepID=A0A2H0TBK5_9BACT|nr:MAG: hypothetical protein COU49_01465 [Candidatus Nomurabacteria bacterium CG10_big_fil_rev_8_21_14_0_10_35_16]
MIEIKDLLLNFRNILLTEDLKKDLIIKIIFSIAGIQLKREDVKIQNGVLYLSTKPIYKNEIFIKQKEILSNLKQELGKKSPIEIR